MKVQRSAKLQSTIYVHGNTEVLGIAKVEWNTNLHGIVKVQGSKKYKKVQKYIVIKKHNGE